MAGTGNDGAGFGCFFSADGYAVTNNHVVEGADKVEVTTDAGKTYTAKVIGTDPADRRGPDQGRGRLGLPVRQAVCGKARTGDWVLAVGNSIRSPAAPSRQASCRPAVATSATFPGGSMTISFRSTRRSTRATRVACFQHAGRSRRREYRDLLAIRRQRRHRILRAIGRTRSCLRFSEKPVGIGHLEDRRARHVRAGAVRHDSLYTELHGAIERVERQFTVVQMQLP